MARRNLTLLSLAGGLAVAFLALFWAVLAPTQLGACPESDPWPAAAANRRLAVSSVASICLHIDAPCVLVRLGFRRPGAAAHFPDRPLGGTTSYAIIKGSSMEPKLSAGDLAVIRSGGEYTVGDVVAYRNQLGSVILHRIIERDGDRLVLKGDNNDFIDSEHPTSDEVIGTLEGHAPRLGGAIGWLRTATGAAAIAVAAMASVLGGGVRFGRRRRRSRPNDDGPTEQRPATRPSPGPRRFAAPALAATAAAAIALLALAWFAYTSPTSRTGHVDDLYTQTGTFTYSAEAPPSPLYDGTEVTSGDPLFFDVVDQVDVTFDYAFESDVPASIVGFGELSVEVTDDGGLRRTFPMVAATAIRAGKLRLRGTFSPDAYESLISLLEARTRVSRSSFEVAIVPSVSITGSVGGNVVSESFGDPLVFGVDESRLTLVADGEGGVAAALSSELAGAGRLPETNGIGLLGREIRVPLARLVAAVGGGIVVGLLLVLGAIVISGRRRPEAEQLADRYASWIVDVAPGTATVPGGAVEVASFADLLRLAETRARAIVHIQAGDRHAYVVDDGGAHYVYRARQVLRERRARDVARDLVASADMDVDRGLLEEVEPTVGPGAHGAGRSAERPPWNGVAAPSETARSAAELETPAGGGSSLPTDGLADRTRMPTGSRRPLLDLSGLDLVLDTSTGTGKRRESSEREWIALARRFERDDAPKTSG